MLHSSRSRSGATLGAALLVLACAEPTGTSADTVGHKPLAAAGQPAAQSEAMVNWHGQQAVFGRTGPVAGASASLVRHLNGASFRMNGADLTPGNAYTLWLVVINNPGACAGSPCSAADFFTNPAVDAQVRFAAGHVAGGSGHTTFAGAVKEGPMQGWLPNRSLLDAMGAEIHLVINDHGPMLPAHMPGMIRTYRGGCADSSPFPAIFPATALADGEPGPNTCRLYQTAVFLAP